MNDINEKASEKSLGKGAIALRKKIIESGKVKDLVTTEDILFSSSSAAADFVTGYSVSGPMTWKNANGLSLKEIESAGNIQNVNENRPWWLIKNKK